MRFNFLFDRQKNSRERMEFFFNTFAFARFIDTFITIYTIQGTFLMFDLLFVIENREVIFFKGHLIFSRVQYEKVY